MSEIKCPHCGEVFKVDEQGYAAIVAQVKTAEFDKAHRPPSLSAATMQFNKV